MTSWPIFRGDPSRPHDDIQNLPDPPSWRTFSGKIHRERDLNRDEEEETTRRLGRWPTADSFAEEPLVARLVNAALFLRRPLLVTGKPGTGKSSLIYAVAKELRLGPVLRWPITSRSTLQEGLYRYDAIGRLQAAQHRETTGEQQDADAPPDAIGDYLRLGPLGTALLASRVPRALLIDELDKSDVDLPNDLLNVFEEGEFDIPELQRLPPSRQRMEIRAADGDDKVLVVGGVVRCNAFPFIVLTSNQERQFPPAFLRRCIRLDIRPPEKERLASIVDAHLGPKLSLQVDRLIADFLERREEGDVAADQLLNAVYILTRGDQPEAEFEQLKNALFKHLAGAEEP